MRSILLAGSLALSVLGGCAASSNKPEAETAQSGKGNPDMICHEESSTGSNISHTVCRPREVTEEDHDNAQRQLSRPQSHPSAPGGGR